MHIVIDQFLFKVIGSLPPVLFKILCQIACYNLSATIRHKSCGIQLSHESVHKWEPSLALSPSFNDSVISLPPNLWLVVDSIFAEDIVTVVHTPVAVEVSPEKLIDKVLGVFISTIFRLEISCLEVNGPDRERAVCKPR